jgi:hypothetical protein
MIIHNGAILPVEVLLVPFRIISLGGIPRNGIHAPVDKDAELIVAEPGGNGTFVETFPFGGIGLGLCK